MFRRPLSFAGFIALTLVSGPAWSSDPSVSPAPKVSAAAGGHETPAFGTGGISLVNIDAIKAQIHRHRGHPVFLHLWASWCAPCLEELPLVNQWAERLRASGAELLSVSLDNPDQRADHVLTLLHERAPLLTAAIARIDDPDRFIGAFRGARGPQWEGSIPALFAFDKKGTLKGQLFGGASEGDLAELAREVGVPEDSKSGTKPVRKASAHAGTKPRI